MASAATPNSDEAAASPPPSLDLLRPSTPLQDYCDDEWADEFDTDKQTNATVDATARACPSHLHFDAAGDVGRFFGLLRARPSTFGALRSLRFGPAGKVTLSSGDLDLPLLAGCCPQLDSLHVHMSSQAAQRAQWGAGEGLASLSSLRHLSLHVSALGSEPPLRYDAAPLLRGVSALRQLQSLALHFNGAVGVRAHLPLLAGLVDLRCARLALGSGELDPCEDAAVADAGLLTPELAQVLARAWPLLESLEWVGVIRAEGLAALAAAGAAHLRSLSLTPYPTSSSACAAQLRSLYEAVAALASSRPLRHLTLDLFYLNDHEKEVSALRSALFAAGPTPYHSVRLRALRGAGTAAEQASACAELVTSIAAHSPSLRELSLADCPPIRILAWLGLPPAWMAQLSALLIEVEEQAESDQAGSPNTPPEPVQAQAATATAATPAFTSSSPSPLASRLQRLLTALPGLRHLSLHLRGASIADLDVFRCPGVLPARLHSLSLFGAPLSPPLWSGNSPPPSPLAYRTTAQFALDVLRSCPSLLAVGGWLSTFLRPSEHSYTPATQQFAIQHVRPWLSTHTHPHAHAYTPVLLGLPDMHAKQQLLALLREAAQSDGEHEHCGDEGAEGR